MRQIQRLCYQILQKFVELNCQVMDKDVWFSPDEYSDRILKLQQALNKRGLGACLGFQAKSVTWLTGYYTRAYGAFQFVIVPTQGEPTIVCRDQ